MMAKKKRKYESQILSGKPLKLQQRPLHEDESSRDAPASIPARLVLPESRDMVLRLIDKIKER